MFRMSMKIGKLELVNLAREIYGDEGMKDRLSRAKKSFREKVERKLWDVLREQYPERDFTRGNEPLTRKHIVRSMEPIFKCKSFVLLA